MSEKLEDFAALSSPAYTARGAEARPGLEQLNVGRSLLSERIAEEDGLVMPPNGLARKTSSNWISRAHSSIPV